MTVTEDLLAQVRDVAAPAAWSTDQATRTAMAHDASHYLLTPRAVHTPRTLGELTAVLARASTAGVPVTFRAGGTSLSGQGVGDGVLIDVRRHFAGFDVLDDGARVRCEPGVLLRKVNAALMPYGRRLGPDPASEIACTIGGVVANNSSGMTSGSAATAYHTMESAVFVLPSGTAIDTAAGDADARLREQEPALHAELARIRDTIRTTPALRRTIEHQFSMKNTMGYGLNAFLDHHEPAQILAHLIVGSEGTLAYLASVVLTTVPAHPHVATSLLVFDDINRATDALPAILGASARAAELMDARALRVAQRLPAAPASMRGIDVDAHTALLVELQAEQETELTEQSQDLLAALADARLSMPAELSQDSAARAAMWTVRKGLYPAVAGARPAGTTNLLEDVAVPAEHLRSTVRDLSELFVRHGYDDAVIFGHARDANLHFMINPRLDDPAQVDTYAAFTEDMVEVILGAGGTLKAEHGTGRIMSAYVERQFGPELYALMRRIKSACDPAGILAPGVVLNEDPVAHLKHLKTMPAAHPLVDACVECGFCEPVCPSRDVTTTPRQRIVLMREMAVADPQRREELAKAFEYQAVQTCAGDSMCVTVCPVGIDTGAVMKGMRAEAAPQAAQRAGRTAAMHWAGTTTAVRAGLGVAAVLPGGVLAAGSRAVRTVAPHDLVPEVGKDLPGPGTKRSALRPGAATTRTPAAGAPADQGAVGVVLFPSCTGAMFGSDSPGAAQAFLDLCARAGVHVRIPERIDSLCCAVPWTSKGLTDGARTMAEQVRQVLTEASEGGRLPVVTDAASCTLGLVESDPGLQVMDALAFVRAHVLPRVPVDPDRRLASVAVHPTCATTHLDVTDDLLALARSVARQVTVPVSWGCCGFAGDRGMLHPELTAGATAPQVAELAAVEARHGAFDAYISANRTCEMGMSRATGRTYEHVLEVLARLVA
ncbi:FAD-binding and (Fe-S)-binding domain-containing protein [Pseudactinotalea sp. Z1739]|uniref:FAD-binding and (Fe-S)-binding domain-containing protein n=1 Tax=Pseudactinotalea sp. Z1739 TaxID=3413028 RepID=UPI003C7B2F8F